MALHLTAILKALPVIVATTDKIVASINTRKKTAGLSGITDEQIRKLEDDVLKTSEALSALARQLESLAEGLRVQQQRIRWVLGAAALTTIVSLVALVVALRG